MDLTARIAIQGKIIQTLGSVTQINEGLYSGKYGGYQNTKVAVIIHYVTIAHL